MSADDQPEEMTAAEIVLAEHLSLLRSTPPAPSALAHRVIRTARWQQAVRAPLLAIAHIASAAVEAMRLLFGSRS